MAFVENIINNQLNIDTILKEKQRNGVQYIEAHRLAAITIQRHYKGYYTRLYFLKLNLAAIIIQKHWKEYMAKRYFNDLIIETFIIKSIDHYNKAAIIIQKNYKGYYTRKYCLDVKRTKRWIKKIQEKNDTWSKVMEDYKKNICREFEKKHKEMVKCMVIEMVKKYHPMLSTKSNKGVFITKEQLYNDSELEKLLRYIYAHINKKMSFKK